MITIGICGDDCLYCPRYIATKKGGNKEMEEVKELWVRLGLREPAFPARDMACLGCRPENKCAYLEVRTCAYEKGIENCGLKTSLHFGFTGMRTAIRLDPPKEFECNKRFSSRSSSFTYRLCFSSALQHGHRYL